MIPYSCSCSCAATSLQWQEMKGGITEGPITYAAMSARPTWPQNIPQGPTALAPPAHELSQVWCAVQLQQTRQDAQQDLTVGKGSVGLVWGNPKTLPQCLLHCTRATKSKTQNRMGHYTVYVKSCKTSEGGLSSLYQPPLQLGRGSTPELGTNCHVEVFGYGTTLLWCFNDKDQQKEC